MADEANFLVRVQSRYESLNANQIVGETKALLRQLANEAKTLAPTEVRARTGIITGAAEERLANVGRTVGKAGVADPEVVAAKRGLNELSNALNGFNTGVRAKVQDVKKILEPILQQTGGNLTPTRARELYEASKRAPIVDDRASRLGVSRPAVDTALEQTRTKQFGAEVEKVLASDDAYAKANAEAAVSRKKTTAMTVEALAADDRYAKATASLALARSQLRERTAAALAAPENIEQFGRTAAADQALDLAQRRSVLAATGSSGQINAQAQVQAAEQFRRLREQAAVARLNDVATPQGQASAQLEAEVATASKRRAATIQALTQRTLAADDEYIRATASASLSRKQIDAKVAQAQAVDGQYATATVALTAARNQLAAQEAAASRDGAALRASTSRALEEERTKRAQDQALREARTPQDRQGDIDERVAREREKASRESALAQRRSIATPEGRSVAELESYTGAESQRRAAFIKAGTERILASDNEYIKNTAVAAEAQREKAARIRAERAGVDTKGLDIAQVEARTALVERTNAERQAAAVARLSAGQDGSLGAAYAAARRERIAAERAAATATVRDSLARGEGTGFQRLQARASLQGPNPRGPLDNATFGGFVGQKALTTAGYAIPGALLYGGGAAIGQLIEQAEELEKQMNQLQAAFTASDAAGDFPRARQAVLDIARDSGVAADEVASTLLQFRGAFQNTDEALEQTASAMKIVAVTGLSVKEVQDSLIATAKTFADENTGVSASLEELGNTALFLQEQYGVNAKETLTFVADLAAVGAEAGATKEELAGLGAITQQLTARDGAALAEAYGRVLPAIGDAKAAILDLYSDPSLGAGREQILTSLGNDDTFGVFQQLLEDSAAGNLTEAQQKYAISLLGSRREAQSLIPVFKEAGKAIEAMNGASGAATGADGDPERLNSYYEKLQETVANSQARMSESFKQLGQALFEAGLADILVTAAGAAELLGKALAGLFAGFGAVNNLTEGFVGKLILMYGAYRLVSAGLVKLAAARATEVVAIGAETTAETINTASANANTAAEVKQAAAKNATAGAATRQAGAVTAGGLILPPGAIPPGAPAAGGRLAGAGAAFSRNFGRNSKLSPGQGAAAASFALVGAGAVFAEYGTQDAKAEGAANKFREKLKKATEDELRAIANTTTGTVDRMSLKFFGEDLPEITAARELAGRESKSARGDVRALIEGNEKKFQEYLKSVGDSGASRAARYAEYFQEVADGNTAIEETEKLFDELGIDRNEDAGYGSTQEFDVKKKDITTDNIKLLIKRAKEGNETAALLIQAIGADVTGDPALQKIIDDYRSTKKAQELEAAAGGEGGLVNQNIDTARTQFEGGAIGRSQYLKALETNVDSLREIVARTGNTDIEGTDALALAKAEKELQDVYAERAKQVFETGKAYREINGQTSAKADLAGLLEMVGTKNSEGGAALSFEQQAELLPEIYKTAQEAFTEELDSISDPIERARRAKQGFRLPAELRLLTQISQLRLDDNYEQVADVVESLVGGNAFAEYEASAITMAEESGKPVKEVLLAIFDSEIRAMQGVIAEYRRRGGDVPAELLAKLNGLVAGRDEIAGELNGTTAVPGVGEFGQADPAALEKLDDNTADNLQRAADRRKAEIERRKIAVRNDPVATARLDLEIAREDLSVSREIANAADQRLAAAIEAGANASEIEDLRQEAADKSLSALQAELGVAQAQAAIVDAQRDQTRALIAARGRLASAQNEGNPVALANIALSIAQQTRNTATTDLEALEGDAAIAEAFNQARAARQEVIQAQFDLLRSTVYNNAARSAEIDVSAAQAVLASARPGVERDRAQAQLNQALQSQRDAFFATLDSMMEMQIAVAEAADDQVKVAELQLQSVRGRLDAAIKQGSGTAELNSLRAEVTRAEANLRNSKFQDQLSDIDYLLEIEQMSVGQAVALLRQMQRIPTNTEKMNRELELKIRGLLSDLNSNVQFNIPDIKIPTLYEVRRLDAQTQAGNSNYQDNRIINVNVNESSNPAAVVQIIRDAVNAPSTVGSTPRLY